MADKEIIINSTIVLLSSGIAAGALQFLSNKKVDIQTWSPTRRLFFGMFMPAILYTCLFWLYSSVLAPKSWWREIVDPLSVGIEGTWLETKNPKDFSRTITKSNAKDLEKDLQEMDKKYTVLSIRFNTRTMNHEVEGYAVASKDQAIYFKSDRVWIDFNNREISFTYNATTDFGEVKGLTRMEMYFDKDGTFTQGQGHFYDDRGYKVEFKLERLPQKFSNSEEIKKFIYANYIKTSN
jgi:hypothetical protein